MKLMKSSRLDADPATLAHVLDSARRGLVRAEERMAAYEYAVQRGRARYDEHKLWRLTHSRVTWCSVIAGIKRDLARMS
ncbi:MAG TPA: hypothetical protein VFS42_03180 [Burkholderiaceae bacterium]|nr:hypothetical protein [Burkholderiaceae bacterium]